MMKNWYLTSLHDHTIQRKGMKTKDKDEASNVDELFPQDVGKWLWGPRVQIEFLTFWVSNRDFHNEKVLRTSMRVTFTCCVIWRSLVVLGRGQKCQLFFRNFRHTYLSGFWRYNSEQVTKNYLRDQENRLACTRKARAETAPLPSHIWKKLGIHHITCYIFWRAARAQPRDRPFGARQSILLITEMLFVTSLAV